MGHKIKTKNRGDAINQNAARVKVLARKIGELGNEMKEAKKSLVAMSDELSELINGDLYDLKEGTNRRLELLERPIWRKLMDRIKDKKGGDPAKPTHRAVMKDRGTIRQRPATGTEKEKGAEDGSDQRSDD